VPLRTTLVHATDDDKFIYLLSVMSPVLGKLLLKSNLSISIITLLQK